MFQTHFCKHHQHGSSSCLNLGAQGFGNLPDPQVKDQEAGCRNFEKKKSASLDVLMEAENFDFEDELRFHRLAAWLDLVLAESGAMTCRRLGGGRLSTKGDGRRFEDVRLLSGVQSEMWTSSGPI